LALIGLGGALWYGARSTAEAPSAVPPWVRFPAEAWSALSPAEAGLDSLAFRRWVETRRMEFGKGYGGQRPDTGGVVLVRGGYVIAGWGDPAFRFQSASLGKTFTRMALQLAIDEGLIAGLDDPVHRYWSGEGELDLHKRLTHGHHRSLTFRHLAEMRGGFPVTNGYFWARRTDGRGQFYPGIPAWARWTGDPDFDNYAHVSPGTEQHYSSGGYWRLSQALTAVWKKDLKQVLDERIMGRIGIPPERWEWLAGEHVRHERAFYPDMPGYADFVDAPHTIDGVPVVGGGGWVVMNALDLARVGLLIAAGGRWESERLISQIEGNEAVGAFRVDGWGAVDTAREGYFAFARVAAGFDDPSPEELAAWIAGPVAPRPGLRPHFPDPLTFTPKHVSR
jgi:CubicO group peptidase (beta-lactamase class C family)